MCLRPNSQVEQEWGIKMDNTQLEAVLEEYVQDRQKEKYVAVMEVLEKAMILVPAMPPQGLDEETEKLMKEGRQIKLPPEAKVVPCLLRKETGEQALPIFTSAAQIPQDKKSPALMAMPFGSCVSMIMANKGQVEAVVLNPFTHNMVLPQEILNVAAKRLNAPKQPKTIKVTEKQFQQLVHNRVTLQLLPKYLFENKEEGLKHLQHEEGELILQFYRDCYPEDRKSAVAVRQDDFSVMALNVTEDMQITRIDMPEEAAKNGICYRAYAVWLRETKELRYYTLEKTEQGNQIGQVSPDGKHELVEQAPDNGAEIEAVMGLAARM